MFMGLFCGTLWFLRPHVPETGFLWTQGALLSSSLIGYNSEIKRFAASIRIIISYYYLVYINNRIFMLALINYCANLGAYFVLNFVLFVNETFVLRIFFKEGGIFALLWNLLNKIHFFRERKRIQSVSKTQELFN